jgi:diacylglycerol O-acyltransferase
MHVPFANQREDSGDRISPLDMSNLRIEEHGMSMHMAALALLVGQPLRDEAGELRIQEIRWYVEERSRHVDRLHQVLVWPTGGHQAPAWEDDPRFDIGHHVMARMLPPPGDEKTLLRVSCDLTAPRLDRSRPLWELWLLDGLADGRVALLLRLHHVVADGNAALDLISSMFDLAPAATAPAPTHEAPTRPWSVTTAPVPDRQVDHKPTRVARMKAIAAGGAAWVDRTWALVRLGRAPVLSWNQPVGPHRVHLLVRADLARAKAVAHQHGGKVNDVVLAALGGGAYRLLESRGEVTPDLDMHVSVAASVRRPGETGGNRVGVRVAAVPVSDPDAISRLDTISARTSEQRHWRPLQPSGRFLQRGMVAIMKHQRLINMVLSNMSGPPAPLWFAGAQAQETFQLSVLQGNCAIGVGVLSYAGQLNLDIVADPEIVPDVGVFAEGVAGALEQLGAARGNAALPPS